MPFFTSKKEKHLWIWVLAVFAAIFSTLFIGQPLAAIFGNQDVQALIFGSVMILVGITIVVHAFRTKANKIEITVLIGVVAVYSMLFLRLGLPERSHLMEYSVLAIFIHNAINERVKQGKKVFIPALLAIMIAFMVGVFDECIQIFLPNRVFDPMDIVFNGFAIVMAIGFSVLIKWVRRQIQKRKLKR
ncbi:VanZ family protein [Aquimarina rubra]|uniref:VanZ family protein n=1 Tax=Aquimarina rubra TaxID=1920033 RepID=A0ABW5LB16_9FLAO